MGKGQRRGQKSELFTAQEMESSLKGLPELLDFRGQRGSKIILLFPIC